MGETSCDAQVLIFKLRMRDIWDDIASSILGSGPDSSLIHCEFRSYDTSIAAGFDLSK